VNDIADLQAQLMAMRLAVEGLWLSLLTPDPQAIEHVVRMREENSKAIAQLDASSDAARVMRDAVRKHVEQLWGSIEWQLREARK
jgi:hypothetical protein